ncbi:MAG: PrsW family intramembrane metalloprotease [Butyrivibrio sp.]|nr:PrsW family intramembrane metalloprotease [Butyrivibrio sp.]
MDYNTLLAFMAVLPAAVLIFIVYKMDKVEKEPIGLLAFVFLMGLLTTISAFILETIGGLILTPLFGGESNIIYSFLFYFLVVAGAEEGGKYFVLKKSTWNNPNLNYSYDGIIYSVCASLGFATLENILYVFQYGFGVAIMRALLSVPGHCIFGVFMGVYYGLAKGNEIRGNFKGRDINLKKAFWIPVALHGTYDFCLTSGQNLQIFFLVFIALEIFMVVRAIKLVRLMSHTDSPFIPMQAGAMPMGQPYMQGGMQPQFMQGQAMQQPYMQAQGTPQQFAQAQPAQPQAPVTEQLGGSGEAIPEIVLQNEPLDDGLTNPNPVFTSDQL